MPVTTPSGAAGAEDESASRMQGQRQVPEAEDVEAVALPDGGVVPGSRAE
jgi:hypothetical protein